MNNTTRELLILATGLVIGATVSHIITKKVMEESFIKSLKELDEDLESDAQKRSEDRMTKFRDHVDTRTLFAVPTAAPGSLTESLEKRKQQLMEEAEEEYGEYEDKVSKYDRMVKEEPYLIDVEAFADPDEEFDNHDKVTIFYYSEDATFADENDELIEEHIKKFGSDIIDCFKNDAEANVGYVRNEKEEIDYEIIKIDGAYSTIALGGGDDYSDES